MRQDFSAVQPVADHGPWPSNQRFDYFVQVRPATPDDLKVRGPLVPAFQAIDRQYREPVAHRFMLRARLKVANFRAR